MKPAIAFFVLVAAGVYTWSAEAATLDQVKARDHLVCGVSEGLLGFSHLNTAGQWEGFDVDICRSLAAAIFGDRSKVRFVPLSAKDRFQALSTAKIDVLSRNTTWTMSRDIGLGLTFPAIAYYDGQSFMIPSALVIARVAHLSGARICVLSGTTAETNIARQFVRMSMTYSLIKSNSRGELLARYEKGECDVFSADRSALFAVRLQLQDPSQHMILSEVISKEPLGPAVKDGDAQWADIVRWTIAALINAEELKITRLALTNKKGGNISNEQEGFLKSAGKLGVKLGLSDQWVRDVIAAVGNYGEIFERNLGSESRLGIARGQNSLWRDGGLIYAPPMR